MHNHPKIFIETVKTSPIILTEGSVIERLKREFKYPLDNFLLNAQMIYSEGGRELLRKIYKQYLEQAKEAGLPVILLSPTWCANAERIEKAGLSHKNVNADAVRFMQDIRTEFRNFAGSIFIGGLTGCKGDAYKPSEALTEKEAEEFHKPQVKELSEAGADFLFASTLPALSEAKGIAKTMSSAGTPYMLSFVIRADGNLLDGTPLSSAVEEIDAFTSVPPLYYMVNCVHPAIFQRAVYVNGRISGPIQKRVIGLQANSSDKSPEELDNLDALESDDPDNWGNAMAELHNKMNLKILGGCCGTNNSHIECLIKHLRETV